MVCQSVGQVVCNARISHSGIECHAEAWHWEFSFFSRRYFRSTALTSPQAFSRRKSLQVSTVLNVMA
jgi:hypothetical protein